MTFVAIAMLRDKPPGSFVVRNSNTFQGAFGLALKVAQVPPNVQIKEGGRFVVSSFPDLLNLPISH